MCPINLRKDKYIIYSIPLPCKPLFFVLPHCPIQFRKVPSDHASMSTPCKLSHTLLARPQSTYIFFLILFNIATLSLAIFPCITINNSSPSMKHANISRLLPYCHHLPKLLILLFEVTPSNHFSPLNIPVSQYCSGNEVPELNVLF